MNKLFVGISLLFITQITQAQITADSLEKKLMALEEKIFVADSTNYANYYNVSYEAYFLFDKLSYKSSGFYENIKNDIFLIELLNVNNPNALDLQKRILEQLQKTLVSKVYDLIGKDSTKKRGIFKTIRNIFTSPIAQDIFKFIPFNNTISSIIASISGIVTPETKSRNVALTTITEATGDIKTLLENTPLSEITKEIMPYMQFYDSLYLLNSRFANSMEMIKSKAYELKSFVANQTPTMQTLSAWNPNASMVERIASFDKLFVPLNIVRNNPNFNIAQIVKIQKLYNVANPIIDAYSRYLLLQKEYDSKFAAIKQDYLRLLERFKNKNTIFEAMLSPIVINLKQLDKPEIVSTASSTNAEILFSATMPKFSDALEQRLKEIMETNANIEAKYKENTDVNSYRIKKAIFK